jgi:SAM-dependent methyltransferase
MLTELQYRILKLVSRRDFDTGEDFYDGKSKLDALLGPDLAAHVVGKVVIDFGCGKGLEAIDLAHRGAKRVIGIDNREEILEVARENAAKAGVQRVCTFSASTIERADVIISVDCFEHFAKPAEVLEIMNVLLHPHGEVLISFGPPWRHPLGGHLFSVFPWAHLIFSEEALIRWRSARRSDGATRFSEVSGGLNQMTIGKFEQLVSDSSFEVRAIQLVPIRKLRHIHSSFTREFTTAAVRCHLVKSG